MSTSSFLAIRHLAVEFETRNGIVQALDGINIDINKGDMVAVVGESGSGKSVTAYSVLGLLGDNGKISRGSIVYDGMKIHPADKSIFGEIRGNEISMIFQNPMSTLNPIRSVGNQIRDMLLQHVRATRQTADAAVEALLEQVKISDVQRVKKAYPFELSGGMCQRVMIALALACEPRLLIADEPTTGLDVTTQKSIMDLIHNLAQEKGLAVMLITHDLGVAQQYCNRVVVMEKGKVIERSDDHSIFKSPQHPYTQKLLDATPDLYSKVTDLTAEPPQALLSPAPKLSNEPLLSVSNLVKEYSASKRWPWSEKTGGFRAVNNVSFELFKGECLGLVGESGCGKSTLSRVISRLEQPTEGTIIFNGKDISKLSDKEFRESAFRRDIQMVFQDPTGSLNPRHTVAQLIAEPLLRLEASQSKAELAKKVAALAEKVRFPEALIQRLPHQLSGGQKARVGIARAIALNPKLLILDEPTSALDVSVQAIVLQLLEQLRRELGTSYLFVSHDLNVVKMLSQRVLVMQTGEIVEVGETDQVMNNPQHSFTKTLLESIPNLAMSA